MVAPQTRRRWRVGRFVLVLLLVLVAAPAIGLVGLAVTFDPASIKPQIEQAVRRATGRALALRGPVGLKLSLWPTVQAEDVGLANIAGGSRAEMVSVRRIEAQVALLPLLRHRIQIERLLVVQPDILVETDREGRPNWHLHPDGPSETLPQAVPTSRAPSQPYTVSLSAIRIDGGAITYRDGVSGATTTIAIRQADATSRSADAPLALDLQFVFRDMPFRLSGEVGSLARLQDPVATTAWPVKLTLTSGEARATIDGAATEPLHGRGYRARWQASVPDLSTLAKLSDGAVAFPPVHDLRAMGMVFDAGDGRPDVSDATFHAGSADLSRWVPGLSLDQLDLSLPALDQPVRIVATAKRNGAPLAVEGTLGPVAVLLGRAGSAAYPLALQARSGSAEITLDGTLADARHLAQPRFVATLRAPDLAALSPLAGRSLPALKDVVLRGTLASVSDGAGHRSFSVPALSLTSAQGDLAGTIGLVVAGRPKVSADLRSERLDLDALASALPRSEASKQANAGALSPPPSPQPPSATAASGERRLLPDRPLPLDALRLFDLDVRLSVATLRAGGGDYRDASTHLGLDDGRLAIDQFTTQLADGQLEGRASLDATQDRAPVALAVRAPGLPLASLLALAGMPGSATGSLDVDADLHSAGRSARAIAAGLDGHLGLAMVDGSIDGKLVSAVLGPVLRRARLPDVTARGGAIPVRCFAARLASGDGAAQVQTLLLDTSLFYLQGEGSIGLADEMLELRLRPLARLGGTGIVVPLRVSGPWRAPAVEVDAAAAAPGSGQGQHVGIVIGALGADRLIAGGTGDSCGAALARARGGLLGPPPPGIETGKGLKPADLLRQLLR